MGSLGPQVHQAAPPMAMATSNSNTTVFRPGRKGARDIATPPIPHELKPPRKRDPNLPPAALRRAHLFQTLKQIRQQLFLTRNDGGELPDERAVLGIVDG